jgi:hypothetical protein
LVAGPGLTTGAVALGQRVSGGDHDLLPARLDGARPAGAPGVPEGRLAEVPRAAALGVTSGTAALDCAMAALGIGPGDEVLVPAYTWWSDYTCVVHSGALPVFANIDRTLNIDPRIGR